MSSTALVPTSQFLSVGHYVDCLMEMPIKDCCNNFISLRTKWPPNHPINYNVLEAIADVQILRHDEIEAHEISKKRSLLDMRKGFNQKMRTPALDYIPTDADINDQDLDLTVLGYEWKTDDKKASLKSQEASVGRWVKRARVA